MASVFRRRPDYSTGRKLSTVLSIVTVLEHVTLTVDFGSYLVTGTAINTVYNRLGDVIAFNLQISQLNSQNYYIRQNVNSDYHIDQVSTFNLER